MGNQIENKYFLGDNRYELNSIYKWFKIPKLEPKKKNFLGSVVESFSQKKKLNNHQIVSNKHLMHGLVEEYGKGIFFEDKFLLFKEVNHEYDHFEEGTLFKLKWKFCKLGSKKPIFTKKTEILIKSDSSIIFKELGRPSIFYAGNHKVLFQDHYNDSIVDVVAKKDNIFKDPFLNDFQDNLRSKFTKKIIKKHIFLWKKKVVTLHISLIGFKIPVYSFCVNGKFCMLKRNADGPKIPMRPIKLYPMYFSIGDSKLGVVWQHTVKDNAQINEKITVYSGIIDLEEEGDENNGPPLKIVESFIFHIRKRDFGGKTSGFIPQEGLLTKKFFHYQLHSVPIFKKTTLFVFDRNTCKLTFQKFRRNG